MQFQFQKKAAKAARGANLPTAATADRMTNQGVYAISGRGLLEQELFDELRAKVPVIDACITKIIRLTGGFSVKCADERFQGEMDRFCAEVPVNLSQSSLQSFLDGYLDSLLTYGKAAGEILVGGNLQVCGLYNADSALVKVRPARGTFSPEYYAVNAAAEVKIPNPQFILYTALNPSPRYPDGISMLRGLPCLSDILLRIYECVGQNFDRVGNVRYAVSYKPGADGADQAAARERALQIAHEWADGMAAARGGVVKDFITVGDVDIKVIGADNQLIDTEIPVRQLLEQLVTKLSIPPFLLGLNWSTTERMSKQQADILTSELDYFRRLLTPVIRQIVTMFLRLSGMDTDFSVEWDNINLQDESELSKARLNNAQAESIELENEKIKRERGVV
ncbi:MAG: serine/threonine protein phosphatase [Oscillospiraceae bacterium]